MTCGCKKVDDLAEKCRPWAMVLKDMLERVERDSTTSFGDMLLQACIARGLSYPPEDVANALLIATFKRTVSGAPAPKGFA
jgi:hypothetical protein